jgi:hypothetical protein
MNAWKSRLSWTVAAIILSATTAFADEAIGTVKSVKGEASIVRSNAYIMGIAGMQLMETDKIITGPDSALGVSLQDGTLMSFGSKSVSQLNRFRYDPASQHGNMLVTLNKGSMRFVTGLLGRRNPSAVSIRTPTSLIAIHGTDFIVSVEKE